MYRATRKLIQTRQQFSKYLIEDVQVRQVGGGRANACLDNACDAIDRSKGIRVVSGWLVGAFNKRRNSTEIVQHFWNVDGNGNFFDTTPLIGADVEYVVDTAICHYGQENFDRVKSCVASSLLLKDERFIAVDLENSQLKLRNINSLSNEELFESI